MADQQTFEEWWESKPFGDMQVVFETDCRKTWHARDAEVAEKDRRIAELVEPMECGHPKACWIHFTECAHPKYTDTYV